jgi:drug/metabolite transporter (DMT)-like permease
MAMNLRGHIHWPPSMFLVAAVLLIGGALLIAAIAIRRKYRSDTAAIPAILLLLLAAIWNGAIFFAFMSPHNRHVFHLATHRASVFFNAIVGSVWLSLCVASAIKWFHRSSARSRSAYSKWL